MSTTSHTTTFDLERFARAAEERDASTQVAMYAPSATVTIIDKLSPPGSPRVLGSSEEIAAWIEDTCARDMTHSVKQRVRGDAGAAFTEACRYANGTNVLCATVIELAGGQIVDQIVVQAWDED